MTTQPKPGEWRAACYSYALPDGSSSHKVFTSTSPEGDPVAICYAETDGEAKARATLTAAAPDLLAALERARNHLIMDIDRDGKGIQSHDTPEALAQVRAAIAKAKGTG